MTRQVTCDANFQLQEYVDAFHKFSDPLEECTLEVTVSGWILHFGVHEGVPSIEKIVEGELTYLIAKGLTNDVTAQLPVLAGRSNSHFLVESVERAFGDTLSSLIAKPEGWEQFQRFLGRHFGFLGGILRRCGTCGRSLYKIGPEDLPSDVWQKHVDAGTDWIVMQHAWRCPCNCGGPGAGVFIG